MKNLLLAVAGLAVTLASISVQWTPGIVIGTVCLVFGGCMFLSDRRR